MLKTFVLLQCYLSQNLTLVSLSRMLHRIVDQLLCLKKNPLKYEIKKNHEIFATLKTMITQNIFHWIILFLGVMEYKPLMEIRPWTGKDAINGTDTGIRKKIGVDMVIFRSRRGHTSLNVNM